MIDPTLTLPTLDHRRADVGRVVYTINSNRSRLQIIADYAASHDLSARQVDELVRLLPDYTPTARIIPLHPAVRRDKAAG